jgi:APA family basic amino acid/polyamine antiporter
VWLPFLLAFVVATMTAFSYLELVTHYPQAAGAALYTHKAFGIHIVTFLVAFAVICSGITSASTSANVLAQNFFGGLEVNDVMGMPAKGVVTAVALGFMVLLALINLRGVGESVKFNVVLTVVEVTALCIVIGVGFYVIARGDASIGEVTVFTDFQDKGLFLAVTAATSIAFFAMVVSRTRSTWSRRRMIRSGSSPKHAHRARDRGDPLHAGGDLGGRRTHPNRARRYP